MSHFSKREGSIRNSIVFMMLAFLLLFSAAVFAQTTNLYMKSASKEVSINEEKIDVNKQEYNPGTSNLNFVLWFMGTKQDPSTIIIPVRTTELKYFRTFGTTPNRLLIRTFFKKVVNLELATV